MTDHIGHSRHLVGLAADHPESDSWQNGRVLEKSKIEVSRSQPGSRPKWREGGGGKPPI
jgi:hypothetical protein